MSRAVGLVLLALLSAADEPTPLGLTDLAAYRAAVEGRPGGPATPVTFRDLWDRPGEFEGKRVRVEGRVVRRFRQGVYGTFPPLVECWAVTPAGDPFCLVFPETGPAPHAAPGASVRFEGAYLKRLKYRGGDTDRLAPLVVGDRPPDVTAPAPAVPQKPAWWTLGGGDRAIGLGAAALVALALARHHTRAPSRTASRPARDTEPPPEFVDSA